MSGLNLNSSADETTPLLSDSNIKWEALLPSVSETVILEDGDSLDIIDFKHSFRSRQTTPIPVIAFEFLVVLYHLTLRDPNSKDNYHESQEIKVQLKKKALTLFDELCQTFKDNNSEMDTTLGTLLVYRFKLDPAGSKHLCVLDLLNHDEIPHELFIDPFLTRFITHLWQSGWATTQEYPFTTSRVRKLDNILRAPRECLRRCIIAPLVFLLPLLITSFALLSLSLSDALLVPSGPGAAMLTLTLMASPLSIRSGLSIFLSINVLLLIILCGALVAQFPNSPKGTLDSTHWDQYGTEYGIKARRLLIRLINIYSTSPGNNNNTMTPLNYPPPFNLIGYLLIPLNQWLPPKFIVTIWYSIVAPFAFIIAGLWLCSGEYS